MRTTVLLFAALVCACTASAPSDTPAGEVALSVRPDAVPAGEPVTLVLANGSAGTVGYNLCTSALERRTGAGWESVPSDRVCTMELRSLEAGAEATYPMELPDGIAPGEYRFRTAVEDLDTGERATVASEPFRVES